MIALCPLALGLKWENFADRGSHLNPPPLCRLRHTSRTQQASNSNKNRVAYLPALTFPQAAPFACVIEQSFRQQSVQDPPLAARPLLLSSAATLSIKSLGGPIGSSGVAVSITGRSGNGGSPPPAVGGARSLSGLGFRCLVFVRGARAFSLCSFKKHTSSFKKYSNTF
jgi:hypothetical protein